MSFHAPKELMISHSILGMGEGNNGLFRLRVPGTTRFLNIIASDGWGWEHVSVSLPSRCPTWGDMCLVKDTFWDDEDCVVQFHPPKSQYINNHRFCLHLWRSISLEFPIPNKFLI